MKFRFIDLPKAILYFIDFERKKFLFFALLLNLILLSNSISPYIIGKVVDFLTFYKSGDSIKLIYFYVIVLTLSTGTFAFLRLECKKRIQYIGVNAKYRAKTWGFQKLVDFSLSWHQKESTGNKAQRLITGSESILQWMTDIINVIIPTLTSFIIVMFTCLMLSPIFSIFFLLYLFFLVLIEVIIDKKISILSDTINQSMENASGIFVEGASNITSVKALGVGNELSNQIKSKEKMTQDMSHERVRLGSIKWQIVQWHNAISWGVFLFLIALLVIKGTLSVGQVTTYTMYFSMMRQSSTQFTNQFQKMIEQKSNVGRMMDIFWSDYSLESGDQKFPEKFQSLVFDNVSFSYKDESVLKKTSFTIQKGGIIGIVGESGSGKSTLFKLLLGLYHANNGSILLNDVNLKEIKREEVTDHIAVVLQETELFNLSLAENIILGRIVNEHLLKKACETACLNDVIEKLPDGMDSILGEKGFALSGGERQRVGIARAIYQKSQILLMDECTSALDGTTEKEVMNNLVNFQKESEITIILIAHNVKTLSNTDRILVFDKGQIVEDGTFERLKEKDSLFSQFYHEKG